MPTHQQKKAYTLQMLIDLGFISAEAPIVDTSRVVAEEEPMPAPSPSSSGKKDLSEFPDLSLVDRQEAIAAIARKAANCAKCRLHLGRTNSVPGEGNVMSGLMFIGEGPGANEDELGRPFVGRSGQLLDKIINAMGFAREEIFIGNIVKCRPPGNRKPHIDEMDTCFPYLDQQIEIIQPKVIVTLGATALQGLMPEHMKTPIGKLRGQWQSYRGIRLMPTLHPAFLLRQATQKKFVWEDMQKVMKIFGKEPPIK